MDKPAALADHLDEQTDSILLIWRRTVESVGDVPEVGRLSRDEFNDHVPDLLERLSNRLRGHPIKVERQGQLHGEDRWFQGYGIAEVVYELGHLRTTLTQSTTDFAVKYDWNASKLASAIIAINDVLDDVIAESVRQFQKNSRDETLAALEEVKTRQKAFEEAWIAAQQERSKLHTILDSLPLAVWVVDHEGMVVGVNKEAERLKIFGQSDGPNQVNLFHPPHECQILQLDGTPIPYEELAVFRSLRGEPEIHEELIWVIGGKARTVSLTSAPLTGMAGEVAGAVVVAQNITYRKQLEARASASEAQFRSIAENSPAMIWRTDALGHCDYANQTWLKFLGSVAEPDLSKRWLSAIHPEDLSKFKEAFKNAFQSREPYETTYRLRRSDGEYRWISDRANPYDDTHGRFLGYLGSCLDITERVDMENSLAEQRGLAEESSKHKSRLVSTLSHDARTPLNAVALAAQLLEIHLNDHADGEVQNCLRTIRLSVRNVLDLLGDLLNLSQIDAGASPVEETTFSLAPMLTECLASIEPQAHLKGLEVKLEAQSFEGIKARTDRPKLKQILSNLLSNALRYTEQGHIRVHGYSSGDQLHICVEDTGVGISPIDQQRIFDEFAVLEQAKRAEGGTGLGLAICRRLANLLGGEIQLQSALGTGSTFILSLPWELLSNGDPTDEPLARTESLPSSSGSILVAEDHAESRQTLARILRRMGYQVLEAGNGQDVLAITKQESIRAILMDVNMPMMDGVEATLAIRADPAHRNLPIFVLTGDVTLVNQHRIVEAGVNGYLEKPVSWEALKEALDSIDHWTES